MTPLTTSKATSAAHATLASGAGRATAVTSSSRAARAAGVRRWPPRAGLARCLLLLLAAAMPQGLAAAAAPIAAAPASAPAAAPVPAPAAADPARSAGAAPPAAGRVAFDRSRYRPAVLYLNVTKGKDPGQEFIDLVLIPPKGEVIGRRVGIRLEDLRTQLRALYGSLARQDSLRNDDPSAPARLLYRLLLQAVVPDLEKLGITTLILVPDAGLQAVPFAALHDGRSSFGERYAFSLTPSISLMRRELPGSGSGTGQLALGASRFEGLAPLPLVPQEVERIAALGPTERYLDQAFTPDVLLRRAGDPGVRRVHVATHAEFLPGGPSRSKLYAGSGTMDLSRFAALRQRRAGDPLDLFVLSACRTALGDTESELGFAGLALQAGSRSAIGTLWYVDDVATSAFFIVFYRHLQQGLPKAEALQATRRDFANGRIQLRGDQLIGADGTPLLQNLTVQQQRRVETGLQHPFFWAGIALLGTPW